MAQNTGFRGVAIGRTQFAYGCIHIRIQANEITDAGDPVRVQSFDDQRVELLTPPSRNWPEPRKCKIKLGDIVRDVITGTVGVATGRNEEIDGTTRLIVEQSGLTSSGEPRPAILVSIERLEVVDKRELAVSKTSIATSGGPAARQINDLGS